MTLVGSLLAMIQGFQDHSLAQDDMMQLRDGTILFRMEIKSEWILMRFRVEIINVHSD
jgi:hypothetical protein